MAEGAFRFRWELPVTFVQDEKFPDQFSIKVESNHTDIQDKGIWT